LTQTLATASKMANILGEFGLLRPGGLEYRWHVTGTGPIGIVTRLVFMRNPLADADLADRILASRPVGYPKAHPFELEIIGIGTWIDEVGEEHDEVGLVNLTVPAEPSSEFAELTVHHDIWSFHAFDGKPHPEIYRRNAPRLTEALKKLNDLMGFEAKVGSGTMFGEAEGLGIRLENSGPDGLTADVTRWL
jgi:hypothetical protein